MSESPTLALGEEDSPSRQARAWSSVVGVGLSALAVGFLVAILLTPKPPGDGSVEAGFSRDMIVHHEQAVEMAEIVRDRTSDPAIRRLATDIALTQQSQIGRMQGWLDAWRLTSSGSAEHMAWMGHPTSGLMPGMASEEDVMSLSRLPPDRMDIRFLQLMIAHHQGGVLMADALLDERVEPQVEALARGISTSQTSEIEYMRQLLEDRSASEGSAPVTMPPMSG